MQRNNACLLWREHCSGPLPADITLHADLWSAGACQRVTVPAWLM